MSTMPLNIGSASVSTARSPMLFAGSIGFFFIFRVSLIFLFFQSNPVAGTELTIALDLTLIFAAIFFTTNDRIRTRQVPFNAPIRWIFALLAFSLASIAWTGAQSVVAALGYWTGMAADIVIVLLLLRHSDVVGTTESIMKGVVWGAAALALIAWCSPTTADLRIGNEDFLHPNTLGLELAISTLIAQYLAPQGTRWRWLGIALAITLLRTLSKTSIIAFTIAECWYLMRTRRLTRKAKLRICAAALVVIACFWPLLSSYFDTYNNTGSGNQAETLTGRTAIWAVAFAMGLDKPWLGHGFYSFRALVPALGTFEPWEAHNELLQEFFEYGLVGVAIVIGTYLSLYRHIRKAPANELKSLALAVLLFALIHGLTDAVNFDLTYPIWLIAALSLSLVQPGIAEVVL